MTKVIADISMSIDGFVTGPDAGPDNGLGKGGEPLHTWVFENHEVDRAALKRSMDDAGAVVMGRRLFDIIDDPRGWSDDMGYGADLAGRPPFFVVTHRTPAQVRLGLDFTFCADIATAIDEARAAAGDKAVIVMGGGHVIAQCLDAGLVDELRLHIAPIVLGAGTPLFDDVGRRELVQRAVEVSPYATHLRYDVLR
jgi:dihydrofolate reductase